MDEVRKLLIAKAAERGYNLAKLSREIGKNHAYLQQYVHRGVPYRLPETIRPKLAKLLGVNESALRGPITEFEIVDEPDAPDESQRPMVRVVGYVGAGAEAHFYAVSQGDLDEVPAPEWAGAHTVAVEIRGSSLGPLFNGWLVYYDDVRQPPTADLLGKTCVVGLDTGQILIKKLVRGRALETFDLISQDDEPIRGAAVDWAAEVKHIARR